MGNQVNSEAEISPSGRNEFNLSKLEKLGEGSQVGFYKLNDSQGVRIDINALPTSPTGAEDGVAAIERKLNSKIIRGIVLNLLGVSTHFPQLPKIYEIGTNDSSEHTFHTSELDPLETEIYSPKIRGIIQDAYQENSSHPTKTAIVTELLPIKNGLSETHLGKTDFYPLQSISKESRQSYVEGVIKLLEFAKQCLNKGIWPKDVNSNKTWIFSSPDGKTLKIPDIGSFVAIEGSQIAADIKKLYASLISPEWWATFGSTDFNSEKASNPKTDEQEEISSILTEQANKLGIDTTDSTEKSSIEAIRRKAIFLLEKTEQTIIDKTRLSKQREEEINFLQQQDYFKRKNEVGNANERITEIEENLARLKETTPALFATKHDEVRYSYEIVLHDAPQTIQRLESDLEFAHKMGNSKSIDKLEASLTKTKQGLEEATTYSKQLEIKNKLEIELRINKQQLADNQIYEFEKERESKINELAQQLELMESDDGLNERVNQLNNLIDRCKEEIEKQKQDNASAEKSHEKEQTKNDLIKLYEERVNGLTCHQIRPDDVATLISAAGLEGFLETTSMPRTKYLLESIKNGSRNGNSAEEIIEKFIDRLSDEFPKN